MDKKIVLSKGFISHKRQIRVAKSHPPFPLVALVCSTAGVVLLELSVYSPFVEQSHTHIL